METRSDRGHGARGKGAKSLRTTAIERCERSALEEQDDGREANLTLTSWFESSLHALTSGINETRSVRTATLTTPKTAPHSLQRSSASRPFTFTTMQPQQSTPADSCAMIGKLSSRLTLPSYR